MEKFRYRAAVDLDLAAENLEKAQEKLPAARDYIDRLVKANVAIPTFELLGKAEVEDIDPDAKRKAAQVLEAFDNLMLMSVQYRGENFTALCTRTSLGKGYVSIRPIALMLTEKKLDHVRDVEGNPPTEVRKTDPNSKREYRRGDDD